MARTVIDKNLLENTVQNLRAEFPTSPPTGFAGVVSRVVDFFTLSAKGRADKREDERNYFIAHDVANALETVDSSADDLAYNAQLANVISIAGKGGQKIRDSFENVVDSIDLAHKREMMDFQHELVERNDPLDEVASIAGGEKLIAFRDKINAEVTDTTGFLPLDETDRFLASCEDAGYRTQIEEGFKASAAKGPGLLTRALAFLGLTKIDPEALKTTADRMKSLDEQVVAMKNSRYEIAKATTQQKPGALYLAQLQLHAQLSTFLKSIPEKSAVVLKANGEHLLEGIQAGYEKMVKTRADVKKENETRSKVIGEYKTLKHERDTLPVENASLLQEAQQLQQDLFLLEQRVDLQKQTIALGKGNNLENLEKAYSELQETNQQIITQNFSFEKQYNDVVGEVDEKERESTVKSIDNGWEIVKEKELASLSVSAPEENFPTPMLDTKPQTASNQAGKLEMPEMSALTINLLTSEVVASKTVDEIKAVNEQIEGGNKELRKMNTKVSEGVSILKDKVSQKNAELKQLQTEEDAYLRGRKYQEIYLQYQDEKKKFEKVTIPFAKENKEFQWKKSNIRTSLEVEKSQKDVQYKQAINQALIANAMTEKDVPEEVKKNLELASQIMKQQYVMKEELGEKTQDIEKVRERASAEAELKRIEREEAAEKAKEQAQILEDMKKAEMKLKARGFVDSLKGAFKGDEKAGSRERAEQMKEKAKAIQQRDARKMELKKILDRTEDKAVNKASAKEQPVAENQGKVEEDEDTRGEGLGGGPQ